MALPYELSSEDKLLPLAHKHARDSVGAKVNNARHRQRLLVVGGLLLADSIALLLTFALVYIIRFKVFGFLYLPPNSPLRFYSELVFWLIPPWLALLAIYRLYDLKVLHGGIAEYRRTTQACSLAIIMLLALSFFMDEHLIVSRAWLLMIWISSIVVLISTRFVVRRVLYRLRTLGLAMTRVLIVGANAETCRIAQQLIEGRNQPGLQIVGFVGERRCKPRETADSRDVSIRPVSKEVLAWPGAWMGLVEDVRNAVEQHHIDEVIIASTALEQEELFEVVRYLTTSKVEIRLSPTVYEILTTGLEVQEINGLPLVTVSKVRITGLNALLKRLLDIAVSLAILAILSPLWLALALVVKFTSSGPIIHYRKVVGQGGNLFYALKFRTMHTNGDAILAARPDLLEELQSYGKLKDDPRITKVGQLLRKLSLDEIPQLVNVLKGQMSLVGPRMITYQEMIKFGRWQTNLMTVKPGLTGLWQVSGRSNLSYEDRVRLDMHYIRNYSIWIDIQILFQTVPAVLKSRGAY
ncbi:sugar transferase [Candidatus Chlorohelix sp.]|uniref:sugar transferase n=1 Tax=Candidatus Chlorohelix sp. TaxID=3139201 RepID=UPI0030446BB7